MCRGAYGSYLEVRMSTSKQQIGAIRSLPRNASAQEATWLVFQHIGDGYFSSEAAFWNAYDDALEEIGFGYVPHAHSQRKSIMYANKEGWMIHGNDGSVTVKLKLPSWEHEHAEAS